MCCIIDAKYYAQRDINLQFVSYVKHYIKLNVMNFGENLSQFLVTQKDFVIH